MGSASEPSSSGTARGALRPGLRWWARRVVIAGVVILQVGAVASAYGRPHKVFGWQMFNASSDWQAEIVRVEADGSRHDVRDPWPGGYDWSGLVRGRGLDAPVHRQHAHSGLDTTLDLFQSALEWVARHTPADTRTVRLEAVVTSWDNGRDPTVSLLASRDRPEASP